MPIVHISLFEGRTKEQKAQLVEALTQSICATLGCPQGNVRVTIHDLHKHNYFVGGISVEELEEAGAWTQKNEKE